MPKKLVILLAVFMLAIIVWGLFFEGSTTRVIVNGQELSGPFQGAIGLAGLVVAWADRYFNHMGPNIAPRMRPQSA
jgi:hypothetical protein